MQPDKKLLLRWCFWFFLGNALLFWIIGLKYLPSIPWLHTDLINTNYHRHIYLFIVLSYIGQFSLLAFLPCIVISLFALVLPRSIIFILAILAASLGSMLLVVDAFTFSFFHFHLNKMILSLLLKSITMDIFNLSFQEIALGVGVAFFLVFIEIFLAWIIWRFIIVTKRLHFFGYWAAAILGLCAYYSYFMVFMSANWGYEVFALTETARTFPLYSNFLSACLPSNIPMTNLVRFGELNIFHGESADSATLRYPLQTLTFNHEHHKQLNVLVIGIDAWRADMLNPTVTPNLMNFASKSLRFINHFSGGNATGPGLCSMFYGIPATYWPTLSVLKKKPLLIDEMVKHHYIIKAFPSAALDAFEVGKGIFSVDKDTITTVKGKSPGIRDQLATQKFKEFIQQMDHNSQSFFSFIFYDAAHSYCAFDIDNSLFQPAIKVCHRNTLNNESDPIPYFNRYKNALHFIDQQIQDVLTTLEQHHLLDHTIVIITGDHGEEFNDSHLNYWGHASAFTPAQIRTPLIVYWPGEKPKTFSYMTSHYDLAPTLMKNLFGCTSQPLTYSYGYGLFDSTPRPYLFLKSYVDFAIREPEKVTRFYPTGNYEQMKIDGEPIKVMQLEPQKMHKMLGDLRRFYQ